LIGQKNDSKNMNTIIDSRTDKITNATMKVQVKFENGTFQELTFILDKGSPFFVIMDSIHAAPVPVDVEIKGDMILQSSYLTFAPTFVGKLPIRTDLLVEKLK